MHRYTALFSRKIALCETNNIFYSLENLVWHKVNVIFWKCKWNKGKVTIESNTPLSPPEKTPPLYIGLSSSKNEYWSTPPSLLGQFPLKFEKNPTPPPGKSFFSLEHVFSLLIHFCITCVCYLQLFAKILALLSYSKLMTNSQLLF